MQDQHILAIDQGTSGTKAVLFDCEGRIAAKATSPLKSSFPCTGFVEQQPDDIYGSAIDAVKLCLEDFKGQNGTNVNIAACGISNQRETLLLWDSDGKPLCPAVVWQCKRSVDICSRMKDTDIEREVIQKTGLIVDPYFSGTKLIWLFENVPNIRNAIKSGQAYFGTVDSWLLYRLTNGRRYCTDYTNASRTLLFNIDTLKWDDCLLERFGLSGLNLPEVRPSAYQYGQTYFEGLVPEPVKICSMIGDSHAAAMGEGCFTAGTAKATMGTGCSILLNTGRNRIESKQGMVTTICWSTSDRVDYALEGVIVTCGATVKWLRDQLGLFVDNKETADMALSIQDSNGVAVIPAFSGLGTPYWKMDMKAAIMGLTFGCDKRHIVRAALESIPIQIKDVIDAMQADSDITLSGLNVDGGITANGFVMQLLADLSGVNVTNIGIEEVSALGAAYLAALEAGIYQSIDEIAKLNQEKIVFSPGSGQVQAMDTLQQYHRHLHKLLS